MSCATMDVPAFQAMCETERNAFQAWLREVVYGVDEWERENPRITQVDATVDADLMMLCVHRYTMEDGKYVIYRNDSGDVVGVDQTTELRSVPLA